MNKVKEIERLNNLELDNIRKNKNHKTSWHDDYKYSAYIYIGGLSKELTEGDIISIFSQYGEVMDINLMKNKNKEDKIESRGFCFLAYKDQRSCVLAVDNFNGVTILNRSLNVDHVRDYKPKAIVDKDGNETVNYEPNCAPKPILRKVIAKKDKKIEETFGIDPEDPMASYMIKKLKKKSKKDKIKKDKTENKK